MNKSLDVFFETPCLTEQSALLSGITLQKKWFKSADKRIIGHYLQKFIDYNTKLFAFLSVNPSIVGTDQNSSLVFQTKEYIGTVPLRAPDTGKQIGDFVVSPRFSKPHRYEEYIKILALLDSDITPQILDSLPLISGLNYRPPMYLEAIKFITSLEVLLTSTWQKFDCVEKISSEPKGQILWNKYITNAYKIEKQLQFPIRTSMLSELHKEYSEIRFVFDICKNELLSTNTPPRIKYQIMHKLNFIEEKLYNHSPLQTSKIAIKNSDGPIVIICKEQANLILAKAFTAGTAWRVDFSNVFEKFVQYIFKQVAKESGGRLFSNYKFQSMNYSRHSWELRHLEPDAILLKNDTMVVIDAKYKANLFNKFSNSNNLKEDYRHDLHQLLAYSSFNTSDRKYALLCYPSEKIEISKTAYVSNISQITNNVLICGIPLTVNCIIDAKKRLAFEINQILNGQSNYA